MHFCLFAVALSETYRSFPIIQKQNISSNTRRIRVALQSAKTKLGLPVGCCVMLTCVYGYHNDFVTGTFPVSDSVYLEAITAVST